ncbi:hypothetical protein [uncultured Mediterranean phage]|nr:hypothetical protein [uncultured Mediterranean phage]
MIAELFGGGRGLGILTAQSQEDTRSNAENYQDTESIDHSFNDPILGNPDPSIQQPTRVVRKRRIRKQPPPPQKRGAQRYQFPQ